MEGTLKGNRGILLTQMLNKEEKPVVSAEKQERKDMAQAHEDEKKAAISVIH